MGNLLYVLFFGKKDRKFIIINTVVMIYLGLLITIKVLSFFHIEISINDLNYESFVKFIFSKELFFAIITLIALSQILSFFTLFVLFPLRNILLGALRIIPVVLFFILGIIELILIKFMIGSIIYICRCLRKRKFLKLQKVIIEEVFRNPEFNISFMLKACKCIKYKNSDMYRDINYHYLQDINEEIHSSSFFALDKAYKWFVSCLSALIVFLLYDFKELHFLYIATVVFTILNLIMYLIMYKIYISRDSINEIVVKAKRI